MASWKLDFFGTKTAVATEMGVATLAQAVSFDPGVPLNTSDTTLLAHFAAGIVMGQAALAALTGPATKAQISLIGYRDVVAAGSQFSRASKISVASAEIW